MSTESLSEALRNIFGDRLRMLARFGGAGHSCVVVRSLTPEDLDRCAQLSAGWRTAGLETPLFLLEDELPRVLDAFPLELTEIAATRSIVAGDDLLASFAIAKHDLRRACEVQARGHLVHLREAYIEAGGDRQAIARLVAAAVVPFRALVTNVARLDGISPKALVTQLQLENFEQGFPQALGAAERIVDYVDRWSH